MTLTETFALVAIIISLLGLIVTTIHDTIDIVLKLAELQNKNGQKNDRPTLPQASGHSSAMICR